jgi:hypothetical protein
MVPTNFDQVQQNFSNYCAGTTFPNPPDWSFNLRTKLRFLLIDTGLNPPRIVDYVNLASTNSITNLMSALIGNTICMTNDPGRGSPSAMWCTNRVDGSLNPLVPTVGIQNQIYASLTGPDHDHNIQWNDLSAPLEQVPKFRSFLLQGDTNVLHMNAPYQPAKGLLYTIAWQVNDPLVHYTIGDLQVEKSATNPVTPIYYPPGQTNTPDIGGTYPPAGPTGTYPPTTTFYGNHNPTSPRYEPWGGAKGKSPPTATPGTLNTFFLTEFKDPVAFGNRGRGHSDDWDFPVNKFPNIGWLGRVHRGTPWQTIYLKSPGIFTLPNNRTNFNVSREISENFNNINVLFQWMKWTGNYTNSVPNYATNEANRAYSYSANYSPIITNIIAQSAQVPYDAIFTAPTRDYAILDIFTTAINDNASRGLLSVNQSGLAAWSAVLSGVDVLTNLATNAVIEPAGVFLSSPSTNSVVDIVTAMNNASPNQVVPWVQALPGGLQLPLLSGNGTGPTVVAPTSNIPLINIVASINNTRSSVYTNNIITVSNRVTTWRAVVEPNFPGMAFHHKGDILYTPELTMASPYLSGVSIPNLMSDAVYERTPQQILGLTKLDDKPRFVIYSYGQALKPAEHSLVPAGTYYGVCTNYQVTAESATRAVVRIEGLQDTPPRPRVVVESFNALPPD